MSSQRKIIFLLIAVFLLLFCKLALEANAGEDSRGVTSQTVLEGEEVEREIVVESAAEGDPMPSFILKSEGGQLKSSDLLGEPYLIEFIATWCPYCKASAPAFQSVFRDSETTYIVVSAVDEPLSRMRNWRDQYLAGTKAIVATDPGQLINELSIRGTPTTLAVTRKGEIAAVYPGEINRDQIESLLQEIE